VRRSRLLPTDKFKQNGSFASPNDIYLGKKDIVDHKMIPLTYHFAVFEHRQGKYFDYGAWRQRCISI